MERGKKVTHICAGALAVFVTLSGFAACADKEYVPKKLSKNTASLTAALKADVGVREGNAAAFTEKNLGFATDFFKRSFSKDRNVLVSPLSLAAALTMTANGAREETLSETESVLGGTLSELNAGLSAYMERLSRLDGKELTLSLADSIWIKDSVAPSVEREFLQTNTDYYDAQIFSAPFDASTVSDINKWTQNETKGMIGDLLNEIPGDTFMYLINALYFEGKWNVSYKKSNVKEGDFTNADGTISRVKMMDSIEWMYLEDENTTGFIKPYKGQKLALAAFLPDENISIDEYAAGMSAAKWENLFATRKRDVSVSCKIPKFSYDFSLDAGETLKAMGMPSAFDKDNADFTGILPAVYGAYIDRVVQKTRVEVSESGTKAAAVTAVGMGCKSASPVEMEPDYKVILDRPFVYAIIDTENHYPLFLGAVTHL